MVRGRRYWALAAGATLYLAFGHPQVAEAQRSYKVRIDSSPSGATVYVGSKDSDPLGQTPYRGELEAGRHTIILDLDGYAVHVQDIRVKRTRRMQRFPMDLEELAEGQLEIIAAAGADKVDGARVFVDGEDVGNLPDTITVEAGPHQVQVKKEGYKPFEDWVEVSEGETTEIEVSLVRLPGSGPEPAVGEPAKDEEQPLVEAEASKQTSAERKLPFVTLGAGVEVGGRQFRYKEATMGNLRPYDAGGVPLVRVGGEVTPLAMSSNVLLNGWSFTGSYAMATPLDSSATINEGQPDQTSVSVPTTWKELDVGVGYSYRFNNQASYVGARAGYGIHTYTFTYDEQSMELQGTIPDVQYKFVSFGLEGRFAFARRFAFLLGGDTRLVSDTGDIGTRFKRSDVVAIAARGGLAMGFSKRFEGRLMGRFDSYTHTFTPQDAPMFVAEGGTDRYFVGTLTLAFLY